MEIFSIGCKEYEGIKSSSIEECVAYCNKQNVLGLDIETSYKYPKNTYKNEHVYKPGLDPYLSRIVMLQIGTLERIYVIDVRNTDITNLLPVLNDASKLFVGANLKFEAKHLSHNFGVVFQNIWDVMLVEQCLTNGLGMSKENPKGIRYSLQAMAERYLNIKSAEEINLFSPENEEDAVYIDKSIRHNFLHIGDRDFLESEILYGAGDIEYPIQIMELQKKNKYQPTFLFTLENAFCLALADIELAGIGFNPEQWLIVYEEKLIIYKKRLEKLNNYILQNHPSFTNPPDLFNTESTCAIMWTSSDQVVDFFKYLGKCPKERSKQTKKMEYTVGAKALNKLLPAQYKDFYLNEKETDIVSFEDFVLNYLLFKTAEQAVTTFGKDWLKYVHPITKRVHSTYRQILNTGRISSTNPNNQNISAEEGYRKAFVAHRGMKVLDADFASQELRVIADKCKDRDMLSFFNDGHPLFKDDYHSFMGTKMWRIIRNDPDLIITKATHPKERTDSKTISFKIAYGATAWTLKDDFGVSLEEAQNFIDGYFEAVPALRGYFDDVINKVSRQGYIIIDNITERKWFSPFFEEMQNISKKALSYYPSGYQYFPRDKKEKVKEELYKKHPIIKELWSEYFRLKGKLGRLSQNFPIQGTAGSQTKLSVVKFRQRQIEEGWKDKLFLTLLVHDEILAECREDFSEEGAKILEKSMEDGANFFVERVKMKAEAAVGDYWSH